MPRILIVDDEPVILSVLKSILAAPDREFVTAGTGTAAIQAAMQPGSLEVALVDKNLPDRTGLDVARELKHLHPDIEVILLTAYASLDSAIEAIKVGAFDYISKPIEDFDDLNLKVYNASEKVRLKREQRRLLDRFAESEERYRGVFQASSDAIIVCDAETGRIQDANAAAQKLYGYSREELCALRVDDLRVQKGASLAPAGEPGPRLEHHLRKDKTQAAVEITFGQFVFQSRGTLILALRDVSERERLEQQRQLLEANLRQAQKMEAIGRLAGGVAHDFNNLLTVILGNGELIVREVREGMLAERAKEVLEAANRAARLTGQLLGLSRKKPPRAEVINLNDVVTEMQKMLRRTIGENIEVHFAPAADLWRVRADPDQLGQVLLNLAVNARDAMPGGGKLTIVTDNAELDASAGLLEAGLQPGRYVRVSVTDTGCGMSKETMARLFEPFFTTKEAGKGTGLGLATLYGIVQQAGGAVRVYSEPKVGTSFKVYLPTTTESPSAPVRGALPRPAPRGGGETILVAEDEDGVRALLQRILTNHGYQVLESRDGQEALEKAAAHSGEVALLLTDLVMPKLSGRELASRLAEKRPALPVLYISAYAEQAVQEHGLLGTPDPFLHKPFTEDALLRKVALLLDKD